MFLESHDIFCSLKMSRSCLCYNPCSRKVADVVYIISNSWKGLCVLYLHIKGRSWTYRCCFPYSGKGIGVVYVIIHGLWKEQVWLMRDLCHLKKSWNSRGLPLIIFHVLWRPWPYMSCFSYSWKGKSVVYVIIYVLGKAHLSFVSFWGKFLKRPRFACTCYLLYVWFSIFLIRYRGSLWYNPFSGKGTGVLCLI